MNLRKRQAQIQELVAVGPATQEIAERLASGRKPLALTGRGRRPCVPCPLANFRLRSLLHLRFRQLTLPPMLGLSVRTVEAHQWNLFKKLGVASALQLAALLHTKSSDELYARITELEEQVLQLRAELPGNRLVD